MLGPLQFLLLKKIVIGKLCDQYRVLSTYAAIVSGSLVRYLGSGFSIMYWAYLIVFCVGPHIKICVRNPGLNGSTSSALGSPSGTSIYLMREARTGLHSDSVRALILIRT